MSITSGLSVHNTMIDSPMEPQPSFVIDQVLEWLQFEEVVRLRRLNKSSNSRCLCLWRPRDIKVDHRNHEFVQARLFNVPGVDHLSRLEYLTLKVSTPFTHTLLLEGSQTSLKSLFYGTIRQDGVLQQSSDFTSPALRTSLGACRFSHLTTLRLSGAHAVGAVFQLCASEDGLVFLPRLKKLELIGSDLVEWWHSQPNAHFSFPQVEDLTVRWPLGRTANRSLDPILGLIRGCRSSLRRLCLGGRMMCEEGENDLMLTSPIMDGVLEEEVLEQLLQPGSGSKSFLSPGPSTVNVGFESLPVLERVWLHRVREPLVLLSRYPTAPALQNIGADVWELTYVVPSLDDDRHCWPLASRCEWLRESRQLARSAGLPCIRIIRCAFDRFIGRLWADPVPLDCEGLERIEIVGGSFCLERTSQPTEFTGDDSEEETWARQNVLLPCLTFENFPKGSPPPIIELRTAHPQLFFTKTFFHRVMKWRDTSQIVLKNCDIY